MKRVVFVLGVLLTMASCTPMSVYYQPGTTVSRMQSDLLSCEVKALKDAPVANQVRRSPPRFYPGRVYCNGAGHCYRRGGYWIDGTYYTVDVNSRLRGDLVNQCMSRQGYQPVEIRDCPAHIARSVSPGQTDVMPTLSDSTCVARDRDGSWQIIETSG